MRKKKNLILSFLITLIVVSFSLVLLFQFYFVPKSFHVRWTWEGQAWGYVNQEVTISSNGDIRCIDKVNDKQSQGKLSSTELAGLKKAVDGTKFYSLGNTYFQGCCDCADYTITVTEGNKSKTLQVLRRCGGAGVENVPEIPAGLYQFIDKLEDFYSRRLEW